MRKQSYTATNWIHVWSFFVFVKVEEVKRRQHCLMFSSAGSQAQTYFVNFDTLAEYQRWQRQASKVSRTRELTFSEAFWVCDSVSSESLARNPPQVQSHCWFPQTAAMPDFN